MFAYLAFSQDYTQPPKENERVLGTITDFGDLSNEASYNFAYSILLIRAKKNIRVSEKSTRVQVVNVSTG